MGTGRVTNKKAVFRGGAFYIKTELYSEFSGVIKGIRGIGLSVSITCLRPTSEYKNSPIYVRTRTDWYCIEDGAGWNNDGIYWSITMNADLFVETKLNRQNIWIVRNSNTQIGDTNEE